MARVTVEDCLLYVDNRFTLVHVALQRTKQLFAGSKPLVDCKNMQVVCSLREIAEGKVIPNVQTGNNIPKKARNRRGAK